jgi:hypothetical protein
MVSKYSIVKIDIEGAEIHLFEEIISLRKNIENLLLESHDRFMMSTSNSKQYQKGFTSLENFIKDNNLGMHWHTDWI